MAKGYLFISNSTKPTEDVLDSTKPIEPNSFSKAAIWAANEMGWELHMGVNRNHPEIIDSIGYDIKFYDQHTYRNIFALKDNWTAYKNLCAYLKANPQIEIIHCNTPIGGVVGRLAGKKFNKKVIYTAHGFHFYKGAPFLNKTILKWVEKWLARYTDILITINQEDYHSTQSFRVKKDGKTVYIPGVGIDLAPFRKQFFDKMIKREELGLRMEDFVLISVGDLNENKNMATIIKTLQRTPSYCHLLLCGDGPLLQELSDLAIKIGVQDRCHFLGYRPDIVDLLKSSDIFIMASKREGLPRSTMEAMAAGLPCIVSDIRGNRDLIEDGKGGFLVSPEDSIGFTDRILKVKDSHILAKKMSNCNLERITDFDLKTIRTKILSIFKFLD